MRTTCILLCILTFMACQPKSSNPVPASIDPLAASVATLQLETETIHDDAMRDLAAMNRRGRELKRILEVTRMTQEAHTAVLDTLTSMHKAETDMYDWMRNYQAPAANMPPADAKKYLEEQKAKIKANAEHIKSLLE